YLVTTVELKTSEQGCSLSRLSRHPSQSLGGLMGKKLYVGNLPYSVTDKSLHEMFSRVGTVESARLITDRDTGRSKGFGFVEMASDDEAARAISEFNSKELEGRRL